MGNKAITIRDIAEIAGVSKATVSRVISNSSKVKLELKEKILKIMKENNYVPNHMAQSLAGTPRKSIGIVIDELANFFFIEVADGLDQITSEVGYSLTISSSKWDPNKELELVKKLISSRVDGIILAPVSEESESIKLLQDKGIPFLLINICSEDNSIAYVTCDNFKGGVIAGEFFNKMNLQNNILITGFPHQSITYRINGFKSVFRSNNSLIHYENINTYSQGYEMASVILQKNSLKEKRTGIFVTNDNVAIGLTTRLKELGVDIPGQVSVVGYDDIIPSTFCTVPLTTISQSIKDIGKLAAMELLEMIENKDIYRPKHMIAPQLVVRKSAVV